MSQTFITNYYQFIKLVGHLTFLTEQLTKTFGLCGNTIETIVGLFGLFKMNHCM